MPCLDIPERYIDICPGTSATFLTSLEYLKECLDSKFLLLQVTGEPVGEVRAVSGMHERKAEMARFADAFIALPGMVV